MVSGKKETIPVIDKKKLMMTPIGTESVVQQVINKITDAIIAGELRPGEKLPSEMEMISAMHVSRNSLRSAIQTLRAYGVLEVRRPEGTFVASGCAPQMLNPMLYSILLQKEDAAGDLMGLRQIIDMGISKLVINQGLTEEETANLEARQERYAALLRADPPDIQAISEADLEFHRAVAEASHNALAMMLSDFLLDLTSESRYRTIQKVFEEHDAEYLEKSHRKHLDALEKKPGSDIEQALDFSYYYWKNSFNW